MARSRKMNKRNFKILVFFAAAGLAVPISYVIYAIYQMLILGWHPVPGDFLSIGWHQINSILFPGVRGVVGGYDGPPPTWRYIEKIWIEATIRNVLIYAMIGLVFILVRHFKNRTISN